MLATVAVFWEHSLSSILHHILDKGSTYMLDQIFPGLLKGQGHENK